jgi:hypothetical protein
VGLLDRLMDRISRTSPGPVGAGHGPADTTPGTGSDELSEELQSDYGAETPHAAAPGDEQPGAPLP